MKEGLHSRRSRYHASLALVVVVLLCLGGAARAQDDAGNGGGSEKAINAHRVDTPPVIDGELDDPCWQECDLADGFYLRQGQGDVPTQETVVRVCYDEANLYVAFECREEAMDRLSAAVAQRDADELGEDDMVAIALDTFHDRKNSYVISATALGTKKDFHVSERGRSVDVGWNAVWEVETSRHDDRWYAEFEIPFGALRYAGGDEMTWGADFRRSERPHREFTSWSNKDGGTLDSSFYGELRGLSGVASPYALDVRPYFVTAHDPYNPYRTDADFDSDWKFHPDAGLDVEYAPITNVTLNATINPDFAQIESDPNEINLTGNELFLEERRPFFSENLNIFRLPLPLLYTRRMEDITYGAKGTGRVGDGDFALFHVRSDDLPRDEDGVPLEDEDGNLLAPRANDHTALVYRHNFGGNATLGAFGANREQREIYSRVAALTGQANVTTNLRLIGLAAGTWNWGEKGHDEAYAVNWSYDTPKLDSSGEIEWIGEQFDTKTGFIRPDWRGRYGVNGHVWKRFDHESGPTEWTDTVVWGGRYDGLDNEIQEYWYGGEFSTLFRGGTIVGVEANRNYDAVNYPEYPDALIGTAYLVLNATQWSGWVFSFHGGDYHNSDYYRGKVGARLQPVEALTIEFETVGVFLRKHDDLDWFIGDLLANYRFTSTMNLRGIFRGMHVRETVEDEGDPYDDEYDRYAFEFLYSWEYRPGSWFYVVYNQVLEGESGSVEALEPASGVKISYLMRF